MISLFSVFNFSFKIKFCSFNVSIYSLNCFIPIFISYSFELIKSKEAHRIITNTNVKILPNLNELYAVIRFVAFTLLMAILLLIINRESFISL